MRVPFLGLSLSRSKLNFDQSASCLIVGDLGGLGRAVSRWVVENGARELVYLSRSAGRTLEVHSFVE